MRGWIRSLNEDIRTDTEPGGPGTLSHEPGREYSRRTRAHHGHHAGQPAVRSVSAALGGHYQQSWTKTLLKSVLLSMGYSALLIPAVALIAMLTLTML
ncbi:MAG: hypothetical protein QGI55_03790 [Pseudomonadales bacterium]|jgi:hypothetical protein|nr:hypothetical protein [Pseudomonadales bacterium]|tara:strand:- start:820 stop:1113 length:294 start_codon:yes stop_codon:yes gene_type:complete